MPIIPGFAINTNGTLAFLYQQLATDSGGKETWYTQLELTKDDFQNANPRYPLEVSASAGCSQYIIVGQPRLGDYLHLMAVGDVFYGIFSASNVPDLSRFPYGVTFQRHNEFRDQETAGSEGP